MIAWDVEVCPRGPGRCRTTLVYNVGSEPDESFLQEGQQRLIQMVMELKAAEQIAAGRRRRSWRLCNSPTSKG